MRIFTLPLLLSLHSRECALCTASFLSDVIYTKGTIESSSGTERNLADTYFECVYREDKVIEYPLCSGKGRGDYCDGGYDCGSGSGYCECAAGKSFCATGVNPCDLKCHGYISSSETHELGAKPESMWCGKEFGDPFNYTELSCCDNEGYFSALGESYPLGGFDVYVTNESETSAVCKAYTGAAQTMICDPMQGNFVSGDTLKVCLDTCEAWFNACGMPGENFFSEAPYTDPKSLCERAWGGFETNDPCIVNENGYPCKANVRYVEVVESNTDCLNLIHPTPEIIEWYESDTFVDRPSTCNERRSQGSNFGFEWYEYLLIPFFLIAIAAKLYSTYIVERKRLDIGHNEDTDGGEFNNNPPISSLPSQAPNTPAPIVSSSSSQEPIDLSALTGPPIVEATLSDSDPNKPNSLFDQLKSEQASSEPVAVPVVELTFEQKMNLRELEGKKMMGQITQDEFERQKQNIFDSSHNY